MRVQRESIIATLRQRLSSTATRDIFYLASLLAFSLYLGHRFFTAEYLLTGYGDWMYQAYRVKSLLHDGFLTWNHDWSAGFPFWQSYQFIPHLVTLAVVYITGWSITKTMVWLTGVLFVTIRILAYFTGRRAKVSPEGAFASSLLTFCVVGYWPALRDYSLLWGLTIFPVVISLCDEARRDKRWLYLYSLLVGLSIYIHPILAVIAGLGLAVYLFVTAEPLSLRIIVLILILSLASAFYWVPLVLGDKPAFSDPWITSTAAMRSMFPRFLGGLGVCAWLVIATVLWLQLWSQETLGGSQNHGVFHLISFLMAILAAIIFLSYIGMVPRVVNWVQATRWMGFFGILVSLVGGFLVDHLRRTHRFGLLFSALIVVLLVEGHWITMHEIPGLVNQIEDAQIDWINDHLTETGYKNRILTDELTSLSYHAFGMVRTTNNYFGQGTYDLLYPTLIWLIQSREPYSPLGMGDFHLVANYLRATGTSYLILPNHWQMTQALLPGGVFEGMLHLYDQTDGLTIFKVPWHPVQAFYTSRAVASKLSFPDIAYATDEQHEKRDELVRRFVSAIYSTDSVPIEVDYPSQEELSIDIGGLRSDNYLIIFEHYDGSWRATVDGEPVKVERNGPNYIGLDISAFSGDLEIRLVHTMHWTWKVGIALTVLSVLVSAGASLQKRVAR